MTLSDLIVSYLEQFGVEYVFGVPSSPLGPLYDALARSERRGGPRAILTRHEKALCSRKGPALLDVSIDPEEAPPLGMV